MPKVSLVLYCLALNLWGKFTKASTCIYSYIVFLRKSKAIYIYCPAGHDKFVYGESSACPGQYLAYRTLTTS